MGPETAFDWPTIVSKVVIVVALAYAIFVVAWCPCQTLLSCHIVFFWVALAVAIVVAVFWNGLKCYS